MSKSLYMALCLSVASIASPALAQDHQHHNHAHHGDHNSASHTHAQAPIGVMRDHVHHKGGFMASYRMGYMFMDGNRTGTNQVNRAAVLDDYMMAPTEMPMRMHMLGMMYGITDTVTVGLMGGFADKDMDMINRMGVESSMSSKGWLDTKLNAMYQFYQQGNHRVQFNAGLSLPTGSIDERGNDGSILPYAMQTGSGTYDLLPGISYSGAQDKWSWGSQINSVIRLGQNNRGYTLGDQYQVTAWGARQLNDTFSLSLRLDGQKWGDVDGSDRDRQGPNFMSPAQDPDLQAGKRVDALVGLNIRVPEGALKGQRFGIEFGAPIYQDLDGPRLETDYRLMLGWQYAF